MPKKRVPGDLAGDDTIHDKDLSIRFTSKTLSGWRILNGEAARRDSFGQDLIILNHPGHPK
jgi:hypothetical protein